MTPHQPLCCWTQCSTCIGSRGLHRETTRCIRVCSNADLLYADLQIVGKSVDARSGHRARSITISAAETIRGVDSVGSSRLTSSTIIHPSLPFLFTTILLPSYLPILHTAAPLKNKFLMRTNDPAPPHHHQQAAPARVKACVRIGGSGYHTSKLGWSVVDNEGNGVLASIAPHNHAVHIPPGRPKEPLGRTEADWIFTPDVPNRQVFQQTAKEAIRGEHSILTDLLHPSTCIHG